MNDEDKQQDTSSSSPRSTPLFALGRMVATPGALAAIEAADQIPLDFLVRHARGDWGTICEEDRRENELALKEGFRLMSVYTTKTGETMWVISEADRSATTLLLPEEY